LIRISIQAGISEPLPVRESRRALFIPAIRTAYPRSRKTPPPSEDADGVFHAFTSRKVAALGKKTSTLWFRSSRSEIFSDRDPELVPFHCGCSAETLARHLQPWQGACVVSSDQREEMRMKRALVILAVVATVGATVSTAPAQARGLGPGLAFGLAAGAIAAGAAGAYGPYYGPGYGYYGPRNYGPAYYGPGPYAYYGGPYYRHRYYRHW
jgi:hypothetical protein